MRAEGDIVAERAAHYGDPHPNHERIAAMWSAYLGRTVSAHDVAVLMILVKVSRMKADPHHVDNYTDLAGYAQIAQALA